MTQIDDLSCSLVSFEQNSSATVFVEMSESSWLVAGQVPGLDRQPSEEAGTESSRAVIRHRMWSDHTEFRWGKAPASQAA